MEKREEEFGDLLMELEEAEKIGMLSEDEGTYSITVDYGTFFTLLCC